MTTASLSPLCTALAVCLRIQQTQYPADIQNTLLKNSRRFFFKKSYNIEMQMKFVMSEQFLFLSFS